jgi:DNA-binding CsgD family transcriptional regulator
MLYGRARESAEIEGLLGAARAGRGSGVVVRGEAGIGKSALLDHARRSAKGFEVLDARGLQVESELPFVALADLVRPALASIDALPARQAAAIRGALALGPPVESDRFAVAAATLSLLATVAERQPVLAVVDDAHWIDAASREALLFAARRLAADPVLVIFAVREGEGESFDESGLPEVVVGPLEKEAADELVEALTGERATAAVRAEVVAATGGNPLAMVEMAGSLTHDQLSGGATLGEALPAAATVERAFLRRTAALSAGARAALLVAAAGTSDQIGEIESACVLAGADPEGLLEAERAGLLRRDRGIEFQHPLLRAAVYRDAAPEERRRAHGALARALGAAAAAERRAWHLAASAEGYDGEAANALSHIAAEARKRGGLTAAARALERSAELTEDSSARTRRLFDAASNWYLSAGSAQARRLLDAASETCTDPLLRSDIEHLYGQVEMWQGETDAAHRRMTAAAIEVEATDRRRAALMLADASLAALLSGSIQKGIGLARRAHQLAGDLGTEVSAVTGPILANGLLLGAEAEEVRPLLAVWDRIPLEQRSPSVLIQVAPPLTWIEEYDQTRSMLDGLIRVGRELSSPSILVPALWDLGELDFRMGRWSEGYANSTESLSLAQETGQGHHLSLAFVARLEAGRGQEDQARAHGEQAVALGQTVGSGAAVAYGLAALGLLELGLGRPAAAIETLEQLEVALAGMGVREPSVVQSLPDLAESYVREGRLNDARAVTESLALHGERSGIAWTNATAARCSGLLADADGDRYADEFERALEWHTRATQPFETARTRLCYGERLRRGRRVAEAREQLRLALDEFERLGATPWSRKALAELQATGEHRRSRGPETSELTPRELQVALLVAEGATNREAAASLFLTVKTIEFHLGHIYRKLGVRSRTELARRLAARERDASPA